MKSELIILIGSGRAGKTTYAKKVAEEMGHEWISIDDIYHYKGKKQYMEALDYVAKRLNGEPDKSFILDGYIHFDSHFRYLKPMLEHHRIKPVAVFADPDTILARKSTTTRQNIENLYKKGIPECWNIREFGFVDANDGFKKTSYQKIYGSLVTKDDVEDFLKRFAERSNQGWDKYYQTINLPFGLKIQGYNNNHEHASWDTISKMFDFMGKTVADVGCFNGYFCFEAKKSGASIVHGLDRCVPAIETAREISNIMGLEAEFNVFDVEKDALKRKYDVIMLLNVSQHLKNPIVALNKIFKSAKHVILEIQFTNIAKTELMGIAKEHGHAIKREVGSTRPNRTIMLFGRE